MTRLCFATLAMAGAAGLLLTGCQPLYWTGLRFLYDEVALPERQVVRNVAYRSGPDTDAQKHRLNLFLPDSATTTEGWPTVVFVHGGGWTEGDKDLRVGYEDVYGNIGRFFATRGIGAAVVNYRLLDLGDGAPRDDGSDIAWPAQVDDVAAAVAFVHRRIGAYGGAPGRLVLMGHSAGAQLAARVALDDGPLRPYGLSPEEIVRGVIAVSGAGLDLADARSYALSDDPGYYSRRFASGPGWQEVASPAHYVDASDPPTLVLYAGGESATLKRQSHVFASTLANAGVHTRLVRVPGQSHERIVLTLSRDDRTAGPAMLDFIRRLPAG